MNSEIDRAIQLNHQALDQFVKGDSKPLQELYSSRDDVTLANPFGPPALGRTDIFETMERAASFYKDGEAMGFDQMARYETSELAYTVEIERYRTRVAEGNELVQFSLRVTTIFRPEDGGWRITHRHADPITSARPVESIIAR